MQKSIDAGTMVGASVQTYHEKTRLLKPAVAPRPASVVVNGEVSKQFIARSVEGHERVNRSNLKPIKAIWRHHRYPAFFYRLGRIRRMLMRKIRDQALALNISGSFIDQTLGNGFYSQPINNTHNELHEHGVFKTIRLAVRGLSGSSPTNLSASYFTLSNGASIELSQKVVGS